MNKTNLKKKLHRLEAKRYYRDNNKEILKQRYAKGEITKEEFDNMKKDLENS